MAEQKAKVVHGPGPRGMGGPRPKVENPGKLLKRIMAEVFQHYLPHCWPMCRQACSCRPLSTTISSP